MSGEIVHATLNNRDHARGPWSVVEMFLVDEQGHELFGIVVEQLFAEDRITGVRVKRRLGVGSPVPMWGEITGVTDTTIELDKVTQIPKRDFHRLYELD